MIAKLMDKGILFAIGALGYGGIEILFRGHTHWTMLIAGGLCLLGLQAISSRLENVPLVVQALGGALLITAVELTFGLVCNRALHWDVWDYSGMWGNLWGQICPLYSFLWFLLCLPLLFILRRAGRA